MSQTLDRIRPYLRKHFQLNKTEFVPGMTRIPLTVPSYGSEEVEEAVESLLSTWVTMGAKVKRFEEEFAAVGYNPAQDRPETAGTLALMLVGLGLTVKSYPVHPLAGVIVAHLHAD